MIQEFIEKIVKEVDYVHNFFEQNGCLKHAITYTKLTYLISALSNWINRFIFHMKGRKINA